MATRTLNWCTECKVYRADSLPSTCYVAVPVSILVDPGDPFFGIVGVTVTGIRDTEDGDVCCGKVYSLSYDDAVLVTGRILTQTNILALLCVSSLAQAYRVYRRQIDSECCED